MSGGHPSDSDAADQSTQPPRGKRKEEGLGPRRILTMVVAVVVIAATGLTIALLRESPARVTIGVIIPQEEGPVSHSEEVMDAVLMAMDELNAWGGIGNTRLRMVAVEVPAVEDEIVQAFWDMEEAHHPLAYITISCAFLGTMAPLAEEASAPLIGLSSYPGATDGYQFTYRYNIPPDVEVGSAIRTLNYLGASSVGLLYSDSPHGCSVHETFIAAWEETGGTIESQICAEGDADFSDEVANLTDNDAIYAVSTCVSLSQMFEAIRDNGYDGHVLGSSCASSTFMWSVEAADGAYVSAPLLYKQENILARAFMEDFRQTFGIGVTHHGAVAYDIVHMIHGLLEGKEVTRNSLEYELSRGFIFTGVMGSLTISPGDHDFDFDVYPARIVEGELLYL